MIIQQNPTIIRDAILTLGRSIRSDAFHLSWTADGAAWFTALETSAPTVESLRGSLAALEISLSAHARNHTTTWATLNDNIVAAADFAAVSRLTVSVLESLHPEALVAEWTPQTAATWRATLMELPATSRTIFATPTPAA